MLEKIRLSEIPGIEGLKKYPKGFPGRGQMYLYHEKGSDHNRRIYETIGNVMVPLFSFHEKTSGGVKKVDFFDIKGNPLVSSGNPARKFRFLPEAIIGTPASNPAGLLFMEIIPPD
jgi:hypothetical protein